MMKRGSLYSHQPSLVDEKKARAKSKYQADEKAQAKSEHQRLLDDYLELQKKFVSKKRRLTTVKQRRETLLDEVGFLRHRLNYLKKKQSEESEPQWQQQALAGGRPQTILSRSKSLTKAGEMGANKATFKKPTSSPMVVSNPILGAEGRNVAGKGVVSKPPRVPRLDKKYMEEKKAGKRKYPRKFYTFSQPSLSELDLFSSSQICPIVLALCRNRERV